MEKIVINHFAVWIMVVVHQVVPAIWYSNALFANRWMRLSNLKPEDFTNTNPNQYIIPIVGAILTCYLMAFALSALGVTNSGWGALWGFLFGFCFVFMTELTHDVFSLRSWRLTMLNAGLTVLLYTATGALLGGWQPAA